ncbi:MAG: arginine--tRNA ligase [Clostridiaceae bacterium]|nr:arginine--tRNA ligase [Eubacteriales bacterium]
MDDRHALSAALGEKLNMEADALSEWFETPPSDDLGDYAFPCFRLAKTMRKAPNLIAAELAPQIVLPAGFSRAEAVGGYINFFVNKADYAKSVLTRVRNEGERYGASDEGAGRNVCIDYSSVNIAKPFGIHHLSTTAIGHALYRIYNFLGYKSIGINHLGDWGTQFGKMIVAYQKWGDKETVDREGVRSLVELYVRFHQEAEKDASLNDEGRAWFRKIELGDKEALSLFNWFKELTMRDVMRVYELLDIRFDSYAGESFYEDKMLPVVEELREKGLLKVDQGASIVDLSAYDMPPCIILRTDGATLYATRDLATAIYRKNTYDFAKSLYVVAYQQSLHFRQFFKVLELMGKAWVKDMEHVSFGMVSFDGASFSTRQGNVVYLEDVLNASIERTLEIIKEKSPEMENKEAVARDVGVGAVIWSVLYNSKIKDINFTWERALNFDGETGPYTQYTYARCQSVLRKAGTFDFAAPDFAALTDASSMALLRALAAFPDAVKAAANKNEPFLVSRAVMEICSAFNKFYYDNRILGEAENVKNARLALCEAAGTVIKTGLYLVGLKAPERM